ncbi:MAG TPA: glycosyltransferase family 2 protein [Pyrinomonadaceae bacterium]|nr:glycosyltransferase family 2 protein [Pyrinomonadaceae bacterium]
MKRAMTEPKISVVMPVHNAGRFLDAAIRSIVNQTFADFEFVIVDDNSTDGSLEISRKWANLDQRIRLCENKERQGHAATSNLAVSLARAKYVARMDADDISHGERLASEWTVISKSADIVLVGTLADGIDAEGRTVRPRDRYRIIRRSYFAPFPHGSILFRKDTFNAVMGYAGSTMRVGDQDLYHRMAKHGRIRTLPDVLYHYRYHSENSTLNKVAASGGNGHPATDPLYEEGAMRLWAGDTPGILAELRATERSSKSPKVRTSILARWGSASPSSLRAFIRSSVWSRDQLAGLWIKDGKAYDWRMSEAPCQKPDRKEAQL